MEKVEFVIKPVGYVRHTDNGTYLELLDKYAEAVKEVEGFSYINVLWWAHLTDDEDYREILECEEPYKGAPEKVGIFATRSPIRPNPILLTAVNIVKIG